MAQIDSPVAVLALQGDFTAHIRHLESIGQPAKEVRRPEQLANTAGLVIPGAESTSLLKLMAPLKFQQAILNYHAEGRPIFGTCAGVIMLAQKIHDSDQESLDLLNIEVERNSYGRQVASFETHGVWSPTQEPLEMVFIRAPRILSCSRDVTILATMDSEPVLVQQGNVLGCTFHPELTSDDRVHRHFLSMC